MGIDVGVARIEYNYAPEPGPVHEFVKFLMEHDFDADWWMGSEGNILVGYARDSMRGMVNRYVHTRAWTG